MRIFKATLTHETGVQMVWLIEAATLLAADRIVQAMGYGWSTVTVERA